MIWHLMLMVISCGFVAACPDSCSCHHDQGVYSASCSAIPYTFGKIEALTVRTLRPPSTPLELTDGQFNQARHLKYLSLRNNSIYFIHKKAFYGIRGIEEIDLSFNYIEELDPVIFQHLTSLNTLILRGNPLQIIPEVPLVVSSSIQKLDIGNCGLESIPRGILYGLKKLISLSIDGNLVKSLKYNSLPKGLKYINLSQNLIVNVPVEVISSLTNLRRINLSGNPINCTCSLMNLKDWLSDRGVIMEGNVICTLPHEYSGMSLSQVDETKLCSVEVRREGEIFGKTPTKTLFKERFLPNENSYSKENLQSDQPQSLHPDSQSEVLFQNDETIAMGEMMRDEEHIESLNKKEISSENGNDDKKDKTIATEASENIEGIHVEPEISTKINDVQINKSLESGSESKKSEIESIDATANLNSTEGEFLLKEDGDLNNNFKDKNEFDNPEQNPHITHSEINENSTKELVPILPTLENSTVEYKETNVEDLDEFKQEGFFVDGHKYKTHDNDTIEDSTDIPEVGDTTEDEVFSTQETFAIDDDEENRFDEAQVNISTLIPDMHNETIFDKENHTEDKVLETIPPPVVISELSRTSDSFQNFSQPDVSLVKSNTEISTDQPGSLDDVSAIAPSIFTTNAIEQRIEEVAGAEVLMFCLGVLVICLVLYSVYKCRTSKRRQSMRISKDTESNRGTEMQDMASLLPKPQDDDKSNFKYPDKPLSSENVKLITKNKENETPIQNAEDATTNKIEERNSLNNNTSSSPTAKTPLIAPSNKVTINTAAPIQRTKVKVGIIPDSIPRTPIFVQKSYPNGTKHV